MLHIRKITLSAAIIMTAVFAICAADAQDVNVCACTCMCPIHNNPTPAPLGGIPLGQFKLPGGAGGNGGLLLGRLGGPLQVNRLNLLGHFSL